MAALLAQQSTQLAQPQDDGDALALRYGAEVSLRGARGLGLSVAPVREADDVVFEAAVGGLNLGAADERFVVCNAMVRDDKGPEDATNAEQVAQILNEAMPDLASMLAPLEDDAVNQQQSQSGGAVGG